MAWSWKDIDRITGRSDTGSNISKGVPNWARLAIVANERYQHLLRLHVIDTIRRELGYEWTLRQRSPDAFSFTPPHPPGHHVTLTFTYGRLQLAGNSPELSEIVTILSGLYPAPISERPTNDTTITTFNLTATDDPEGRLERYLCEHGLPV